MINDVLPRETPRSEATKGKGRSEATDRKERGRSLLRYHILFVDILFLFRLPR